MYLKQLMASEIRRNAKKRRLKFKIIMRYLAVSIAFLIPLTFVSTTSLLDSCLHCIWSAF